MNVPDNYDMWGHHEAMQAAWLANLPTCERCGRAIMQDTAVFIDGCWYCDDCLFDLRKDVVEEW